MFEDLLIEEKDIQFFKQNFLSYTNRTHQYSIWKNIDNVWTWKMNNSGIQALIENKEAAQIGCSTLHQASFKAKEIYQKFHKEVYDEEVVVDPSLIIERIFTVKTDPVFYNYTWNNWLGYFIGSQKNWTFRCPEAFALQTLKDFDSIISKYASQNVKQKNQHETLFYNYVWSTRKEFILLLRKALIEQLPKFYQAEDYKIYRDIRQKIIEGKIDFSNYSSLSHNSSWWWIMLINPKVDLTKIFT